MSTVDSPVSPPPELVMQPAPEQLGPDMWVSAESCRLAMHSGYTGPAYFTLLWIGPQGYAARHYGGPREAGAFGTLIPVVSLPPEAETIETIKVAVGDLLALRLGSTAEATLVRITDDRPAGYPSLELAPPS